MADTIIRKFHADIHADIDEKALIRYKTLDGYEVGRFHIEEYLLEGGATDVEIPNILGTWLMLKTTKPVVVQFDSLTGSTLAIRDMVITTRGFTKLFLSNATDVDCHVDILAALEV